MENGIIKHEGFDIAKPEQSLKVAEILQKFVKEKGLTANVKGKQYPLVEAWLFAGAQLGLYPILIGTADLSKEGEIKYMATVEVRRVSDDKLLSKGVAICSNKEATKRQFDEYAILSMAQTRAEGKAFRMLLSWLMKAAGFEATPAEEMDFAKHDDDLKNMVSEPERKLLRDLVYKSDLNEEEMTSAMTAIEFCTDYKQYERIQIRLQSRQKPIDQIQNPNQSDINTHLKKTVRA